MPEKSPKFGLGAMVRFIGKDEVFGTGRTRYFGPVIGEPRWNAADGKWMYHIEHSEGGRKLFWEDELAIW